MPFSHRSPANCPYELHSPDKARLVTPLNGVFYFQEYIRQMKRGLGGVGSRSELAKSKKYVCTFVYKWLLGFAV